MFILHAEKNRLEVREREILTSGSVNVYQVRFGFSEDWDGMERTAVFRAGNRSISVPLDGSNACAIPWDVLEQPEIKLFCGVRGTIGAETVLPTVWADLGWIAPGVRPGQPSGKPPTPESWEQQLARKGDRLGYTGDGELGLYAGDRLLSSVPVEGGGTAYPLGHGLKLDNGKVAVDTVSDFSGDNTLPMTAAGVQTTVGNIEALLGTI